MFMPMLNVVFSSDVLPQLAHLPEVALPSSIDEKTERLRLIELCAKAMACDLNKILVMRPIITEKREFILALLNTCDAQLILELKRTGRASFNPVTKIWSYTPREYKQRALNIDLGSAISNSDIEYVIAFDSGKAKVYQTQN